jgi:phenylacetic acid degradation operon negative regulatory protein
MQPSAFQDLTTHVTTDRPPRVWSLLVTVFGELAQDCDARISGSLLRHLCEHISIKPEAMRVALHRLRKDGWIDSERTGRTSDYFLTPWGREQSIAASPRIYAKGPAALNAWLVMFNPGRQAQDDPMSGSWISSNLLVTSVPPDKDDVVAIELHIEDTLPEWVTSKVCDPATVELSQTFLTALDTLHTSLDASAELTPMQIAALRVLLVHGWRRIVLKAPVLPDHVFPDGWRGIECRNRTSDLLDQLPKQDVAELEQGLLTDASI